MTIEKLAAADIDLQLASLNADLPDPWRDEDGALGKTFRFTDFSHAFAFMTRVALAAERMDHHPDWRNVWNRVEVRLSTHDAGGITDRDFRLAEVMQAAAGGAAR